jgi:hypothetical protein
MLDACESPPLIKTTGEASRSGETANRLLSETELHESGGIASIRGTHRAGNPPGCYETIVCPQPGENTGQLSSKLQKEAMECLKREARANGIDPGEPGWQGKLMEKNLAKYGRPFSGAKCH